MQFLLKKTKNFVTFERWDEVKDEKFWYYGGSLKNRIFIGNGGGNGGVGGRWGGGALRLVDISPNGNLCFRVFKLQLKVINKNVCYLYSA